MAGIKLASAGDDIKLWDCSGYNQIRQFNPHTNQNVSCLCWSQDNSVIASSSTGGDKISLSFTAEGSSAFDMSIGESRTCLAFNSSSRYLLGGGADGIVHMWDTKTKSLKKSFRDHKGPVTCIQMNAGDSDIASGSETGEVILYNVVSGQGSIPLTTPRVQSIRQLQYSYFKKSLLGAVSEDGTFNLWDTNRRSLIHSFGDAHKAPATGLAFSHLNEMLMLTVGLDKRIVCYDAVHHSVVTTIAAESPLTAIDLMYDGTTFVVGSTRGMIYVYDLRQTKVPVKKMPAHKSSVHCLAFQNKPSEVGVGSVKTSGSSRKANSNNNPTQSSKAANKKTVRGIPRSEAQTDLNSVSTQGMDTKNNNRVENITTNKDTTNYDSVFSPIRDTSPSPAGGLGTNRTVSAVSTTPAEKPIESAANGSLSKYGDGIFSPLAETGSFSARTQYTSGLSFQTTPPTNTSTKGYPTPGSEHVSDRYQTKADHTHALDTDDGNPPVHTRSSTALSTSPRGVKDKADFHHSRSDPVIISPPSNDHVTRSASTPLSRFNQPTPEDAGATSLPYVQHSKPTTSPVTTPPEATAASSPSALHTSRHHARSRTDLGQGQIGNFQVEMVRSMIDEALEEFRDQIRRDVLNLHMDVLKQFHIQQAEIRTLLQQYSVNEELMAEVERLREENEKLKKKF